VAQNEVDLFQGVWGKDACQPTTALVFIFGNVRHFAVILDAYPVKMPTRIIATPRCQTLAYEG